MGTPIFDQYTIDQLNTGADYLYEARESIDDPDIRVLLDKIIADIDSIIDEAQVRKD